MENLFSETELLAMKSANHLYYGDNLTIMRGMANTSVDLIYLDPPFSSQRSYNLIYKQMTGLPVPEQEEAFCDAWELDPEKEEMARNMPVFLREHDVDDSLVLFWEAWIKALRNTQPKLLAYLVYMSYRLFEMKRILRSTGSIYLHCDPTASHYIKVIMDGIFGHKNFKNEIIWKRTSSHNRTKKWGPVHDTILFYSKSHTFTWNRIVQNYDEDYIKEWYTRRDSRGRYLTDNLMGPGIRGGPSGQSWKGIDPTIKQRHWEVPPDRSLPNWFVFPERYTEMSAQERLDVLDEQDLIHWPPKSNGVPRYKRYLDSQQGVPIQDVISDISPIFAGSTEKLGYPTQKPIGLLSRIIEASSRPGEVIFDPFCGCGTSVYAAHQLKRTWIGCDIAILSIRIVRDVLLKRYGLKEGTHYNVSGVPLSMDGAQDLFERDPHQFQHWAVELAGGFCNKRKSGDHGIDGRIYFQTSAGLESMVISVKGGNITPAYVRELRGVLERESNSQLAGFICLHGSTKGMRDEAAEAGMYNYLGKDYPRLQIRTIDDLLSKKAFDTPSRVQTMDWQKQAVLPF